MIRSKEITDAISLLEKNSYIIIYMTSQMVQDMNECEEMYDGVDGKSCLGCSCNMCIINQSN